ncbi:triosephosphate isomerase [Physocladia obscura]|uniref:Triosephosphate isomerase n=1 Tax=Physocladia obscura TaxID=109957 RepID=A0AAD5XJI3_9FUNG|nr:triosephosphate isomerase [Physocladia obscura]
MGRKFLVGGNWKMNASKQLVNTLVSNLNAAEWNTDEIEVVIAPPAPYLDLVRSLAKPEVYVSAQNIYFEKKGAFTGEISSEFLKDLGITWTILGHSERREIFKESDEVTAKKVAYALGEGLSVIACVGEKLEEREANQTAAVVFRQLAAIATVLKPEDWTHVVVAYEPVWAIGTGKVASPQQAQDVHAEIRTWLRDNVSEAVAEQTRILYGGSVSAKNSADLQTQIDIDGFLIGGASLTGDFITIINTRSA